MKIKKCKICGRLPTHYETEKIVDGDVAYNLFRLSCGKCGIEVYEYIGINTSTYTVIRRWNKLMGRGLK